MQLDILAIGSHPDDIELGCGGTLAAAAAAGRRVGLVHLTRGEAGTRGTAEGRRKEAEAAAEALGAATLDFLDCGDGSLRTGEAEEDAVIEVLRRYRPEIVLGPSPVDRHPDHGRGHRLVEAACFYAGLRARGQGGARGDGEPYRPAALFSYMQHDPFTPSFIVDVTEGWEAKMRALDAHDSQLYSSDEKSDEKNGEDDGPPTLVASREFRLAVEGRARHYGLLIGATYGEPFHARRPLAVADVLQLAPKGLR